MVSAKDVFHTSLDRYGDSPKVYSAFLRRLAATDPRTFLQLARKAFLERELTRGLEVVGHLLASATFLGSLLDLYVESREGAIALATKLMVCEPQLDSILLLHAERARGASLPDSRTILPAIDILDAISSDARLVPRMFRLLKDENPAVRSKVATFIGRRTTNLTWIVNGFHGVDSRVKANALEGLYRFKSDDVAELFKAAISDENNRVAANAILGLYLFGDTSSIPLIHRMASQEQEKFRSSGAWLMGKTADPRFLDALTGLADDPSEIVRKRAVQGLQQVRKTLQSAVPDDRFHLTVVTTSQQADNSTLSATVRDNVAGSIQNIPGTKFLLRVNGRIISDYSTEEIVCPESLDVAFIWIRPPGHDDGITQDLFKNTIRSCIPFRRKDDRWAVVSLSSEPVRTASVRREYFNVAGASPSESRQRYEAYVAAEFSANQTRISHLIDRSPVRADRTSEELFAQVIEDVVAGGKRSQPRHLVFFGSCGGSLVPSRVRDVVLRQGIRLHVVECSGGAHQAEVAELANSSGGSYRIARPDLLIDACQAIYCSVLHQYRLVWKGELGNIELDVFFGQSRENDPVVRLTTVEKGHPAGVIG